ncbi:hypothetical protein OG416_34510 [Streptomyces longwoodensis]|nr:hypothetical protein OG416_34510 [Streptomyces longwoodensis]
MRAGAPGAGHARYGSALQQFQGFGDGGELLRPLGQFTQEHGALHEQFGGGVLVEQGAVVDGGDHQAAGVVVVGEQSQGQHGAGGYGAGELGADAVGGEVVVQGVQRVRGVLEDDEGAGLGGGGGGGVGGGGVGVEEVAEDPFVGGHVQGAVAQGAQQAGHGVGGVDLDVHGQGVAQGSGHAVGAVQGDAAAGDADREEHRRGSAGAAGAVDEHGPHGLQHAALGGAPAARPVGQAAGLGSVQAQPGAADAAQSGGGGRASGPAGGRGGRCGAGGELPAGTAVLGGEPGAVVAQVGASFAAGQGAAGEVGAVELAQQQVCAPGVDQGAVVGEHDAGGQGGGRGPGGSGFQQHQAQCSGAAQVEAAQPVAFEEGGPVAGAVEAAGDLHGDAAVHHQLGAGAAQERGAQDALVVEDRLPGGGEAVGVQRAVPDPDELFDVAAGAGAGVRAGEQGRLLGGGRERGGDGRAGRLGQVPQQLVQLFGQGRWRGGGDGPGRVGQPVQLQAQPRAGEPGAGVHRVGRAAGGGHSAGVVGQRLVRAVQGQAGGGGGQAAQGVAQQRVGAPLPAGAEPAAGGGPARGGGQRAGRGGEPAERVQAGFQAEVDGIRTRQAAHVVAQFGVAGAGVADDVEADLVAFLPVGQGQREHPGEQLLGTEPEPRGEHPGETVGVVRTEGEAGAPGGGGRGGGAWRGGGTGLGGEAGHGGGVGRGPAGGGRVGPALGDLRPVAGLGRVTRQLPQYGDPAGRGAGCAPCR